MPRSIAWTCPEPLFVTSAVFPSGATLNSLGNAPLLIWPSRAGPRLRAAAVLITERLPATPGLPCRLELATRMRRPPSTMVRPIGPAPTLTRAISERDGLERSAAAENPSSVSLSRLVTHT